MDKIYTCAEELVGRTPLLELGRLARSQVLKARVLASWSFSTPPAP